MDSEKTPPKEPAADSIASSREQQIRKRAYEVYLARKGGAGNAIEDWLRAEAEITWKLDY